MKPVDKNILFIVSHLNIGGAEKILCDLILGLRERGFRPVVVCLKKKGPWGEFLFRHNVPLYDLGFKRRWNPSGLLKLFRLCQGEKSRIICSLDHRNAIFVGRLLALLLGQRHIVWQHSLKIAGAEAKKSRLFEMMIKHTTVLSDRIVVCGQTVKKIFIAFGFPPEKIVVIPNGINVMIPNQTGAKNQFKERFNIPAGNKIVGMVAALRPAKAHQVLISAVKQVVAQYPKVSFLLVGEGFREGELKAMGHRLGVGRHLIFTGNISPATDIIPMFDIGVLSSDHEAFPLVILEYMAAGLPVVSTASGGPVEIVGNKKTGYIVPIGDTRAMAEHLLILLKDNALASQMGMAGRKRVCDLFSMDRMVSRFIELFRLLIK